MSENKDQPPFEGFIPLTQENWPASGLKFAWLWWTGFTGRERALLEFSGIMVRLATFCSAPRGWLSREAFLKEFTVYIEAPK